MNASMSNPIQMLLKNKNEGVQSEICNVADAIDIGVV